MDDTYALEFDGELMPGFTREQVEASLLKHTKLTPEKVSALFNSDKPVVLVSNLDIDDAEKRSHYFNTLGLRVQFVTQKKKPSITRSTNQKEVPPTPYEVLDAQSSKPCLNKGADGIAGNKLSESQGPWKGVLKIVAPVVLGLILLLAAYLYLNKDADIGVGSAVCGRVLKC